MWIVVSPSLPVSPAESSCYFTLFLLLICQSLFISGSHCKWTLLSREGTFGQRPQIQEYKEGPGKPTIGLLFGVYEAFQMTLKDVMECVERKKKDFVQEVAAKGGVTNLSAVIKWGTGKSKESKLLSWPIFWESSSFKGWISQPKGPIGLLCHIGLGLPYILLTCGVILQFLYLLKLPTDGSGSHKLIGQNQEKGSSGDSPYTTFVLPIFEGTSLRRREGGREGDELPPSLPPSSHGNSSSPSLSPSATGSFKNG